MDIMIPANGEKFISGRLCEWPEATQSISDDTMTLSPGLGGSKPCATSMGHSCQTCCGKCVHFGKRPDTRVLFENKSFHKKHAEKISKLSDFGKVAIENSTVFLALSILGLFVFN